MPFNNPVVGGTELVRNDIQSRGFVDPAAGDPFGWKISRDGTAQFTGLETTGNASGDAAGYNTISAAQAFYYKGNELQGLLDSYSTGIVGGIVIPGSGGAITGIGATAVQVCYMLVPLVGGRDYRVTVDPFFAKSTVANARFVAQARYKLENGTALAATDPLFGGPALFQNMHAPTVSTFVTFQGSGKQTISPGSSGVYRIGLFLTTTTPNTTDTVGGAGNDIVFWLQDLGPTAAFSGAVLVGTGAVTKTTKSLRISALSSRTYDDANGVSTLGGGFNERLYQGYYFGNGYWRSYIWFDRTATGTGSNGGTLQDMVGIPTASITELSVYLDFPHWYNLSGGHAMVGWHGNTTVSDSTINIAGGSYDLLEFTYTARGQGLWLDLSSSTAIKNAIVAGTFRGIVLGNPGGSTSSTYYGYADGQTGADPPAFHATYSK